jgi:hypothetical protein
MCEHIDAAHLAHVMLPVRVSAMLSDDATPAELSLSRGESGGGCKYTQARDMQGIW